MFRVQGLGFEVYCFGFEVKSSGSGLRFVI